MMARILALPLLVLLLGIGAAAMLVPSAFAFATDEDRVARAFFYSALVFGIVFLLLAVATSGLRVRRRARSQLIALVATFTVLPVMLAVPVYEALGNTTFFNAYVEMVSSLTTTGATLFAPDRLPDAVHLWRAQVGWMGGFFVWVTAAAVLAPMNLGGFEVRSSGTIGRGSTRRTVHTRRVDMSERLTRFAARLFPVYGGLTLSLWAALIVAGDTPFVAICHAMSVLATSGISPVGGPAGSNSGLGGEAILLLFMVFALSRLTFSAEERNEGLASLRADPELRLGLALVATLPLFLFLRHWLGAYEVDDQMNTVAGLRALWGSVFTVMSFLTTTGFESAAWESARGWSGLETPGLILMGLAVFGGGVATTAGGVKLLRVYALYTHGLREMEKLVHPSSVGGAGQWARQIRRQGANVAWIFFMLFAMSIAAVMGAFALVGVDFEEALILTIAGLTTTGPLTVVAGADPIDLAQLSESARAILLAAMVIGRLESLALIALLNPNFWRS